MKRLLSKLWGTATEGETEGLAAPPAPEELSYIIGDIHGCLSALTRLLEIIEEDADGRPHTIVTVGDYVDRGPESRGVLTLLCGLSSENGKVICLMGNHDRMLLEFLAAPQASGLWLRVGGRETLTSFGVAEPRGIAPGDIGGRLEALARALGSAMGSELISWLDARPLWWRSGNVIAVHALTDPALPIEDQSEQTLLWARPDRRIAPRADGHWVVHGHTITDTPTVRAGHIAIDTGAFRGAPLTAVALAPGAEPRFLQARSL